MSVYVSAWCWRHSQSKGTDRLVLLSIADQADDDGLNAFPSYVTIAERCGGISTKTVQRCVTNLEALGELAVEHGAGPAREGKTRQRANRYSFPAYRADLKGGHPDQSSPPPARKARTSRSERVDISSQRVDTAMSSYPSLDPSLDPSSCATPAGAADGLFDEPGGSSKTGKQPPVDGDLFEEFWKTYPRKTDKKKARVAWVRAVKDHDPRELINAAARFAQSRRGEDPRYTAHPTTWLNGERWNDEPIYARTGNGHVTARDVQDMRAAAAMRRAAMNVDGDF